MLNVLPPLCPICVPPYDYGYTGMMVSFRVHNFDISADLESQVADYMFTRQRRIKLSHLYLPNKESLYWYGSGVNWRAVVAWVCGVFPLMRESSMLLAHDVGLTINYRCSCSRLRRCRFSWNNYGCRGLDARLSARMDLRLRRQWSSPLHS